MGLGIFSKPAANTQGFIIKTHILTAQELGRVLVGANTYIDPKPIEFNCTTVQMDVDLTMIPFRKRPI